jgi:hypothetical protein
MASISTSNVTSGFIDLATFDEIEKYMYGGPDATAYFVRETRKSTWFTMVPVVLSRASGTPAFGQEWSVSISRAGDYLLQSWLRLQTPAVTLASAQAGQCLKWTNNLMHNIVRECCITFNDLVAARFDSYHLDFWAAFTVPAGKQQGYQNMIGNIPSLITPVLPGYTLGAATLNLPLPFFYTRDSGVALPTAALPYNEMRINFSFRDWYELLTIIPTDNTTTGSPVNSSATQLSSGIPALNGATQVWANYAIVSNDERKRMACAPRDILIEQVQTAPRQNYQPTSTNYAPNFDIRFSHAIKALFFAVRNNTDRSEYSNYTSASFVCTPSSGGQAAINLPIATGLDPILQTSLIYENTNRLSQMGSDYFSLVNPYYHAPVIPNVTGYHEYSYSLDFICLDPMGSTNYGKLTNVSIIPESSTAAFNGYAGNQGAGTGQQTPQTFEFIITAVNNNIIRISGGALGQKGRPKTGRYFKRCGNSFKGKYCNYHSLTNC